jgi:hypothetical protein
MKGRPPLPALLPDISRASSWLSDLRHVAVRNRVLVRLLDKETGEALSRPRPARVSRPIAPRHIRHEKFSMYTVSVHAKPRELRRMSQAAARQDVLPLL